MRVGVLPGSCVGGTQHNPCSTASRVRLDPANKVRLDFTNTGTVCGVVPVGSPPAADTLGGRRSPIRDGREGFAQMQSLRAGLRKATDVRPLRERLHLLFHAPRRLLSTLDMNAHRFEFSLRLPAISAFTHAAGTVG